MKTTIFLILALILLFDDHRINDDRKLHTTVQFLRSCLLKFVPKHLILHFNYVCSGEIIRAKYKCMYMYIYIDCIFLLPRRNSPTRARDASFLRSLGHTQ